MYSLNWVDYSIIVLVIFSTVISFFRGFTREVISFIVWTFGILVALRFAEPLQIYFMTWVDSSTLRYVLAFLMLFIIVFMVGVLMNAFVHLFIRKAGLHLTDRLLGVLFGAARGLVVVAVLLMFATVGNIQDTNGLMESRLAGKFKPVVSWLNAFLPQQMREFSQWVAVGSQSEEIEFNNFNNNSEHS